MLICTKIADLQAFLSKIKATGQTLGFVPTMGALHRGHLSLIDYSKQSCDITVCSIFVNPTQFNDKKDLETYPRMPEKDIKLLENAGCDALFMPSVEEIYPQNEKAGFDFGPLDKVLEGSHRPGHFNGVAQVVKRLFEIVKPDKAFFGSKDYQQVLIVKALVKKMGAPIEIVPCPILREKDGLAMSSRNALLNEQERSLAGHIPLMMNEAKRIVKNEGVEAARAFVKKEVDKEPLMKLDYYEVCDPDTLQAFAGKRTARAISLIALYVGRVRLIDNLLLG